MIPAAAGWRIVMVDREGGGSMALPIVAWKPVDQDHHLVPVYAPAEQGVLPQALRSDESFLGLLAPGQEHDGSWDEFAREELEREAREEASG